jgi:hypothetical protein
MVGKEMSPILIDLETALWNFEENDGGKPEYTDEGFRASIKIFMSALMDKMYDLQKKENIDQADREAMATQVGLDLRDLIKTYTNIDTHKLYD